MSETAMATSGKHKRGHRGSVEDEASCAKKSNMADQDERVEQTEDENTISFEEQEPSLRDIKNLLVNIQTTVASISRENKELKQELTDLKNSFAFYDQELQEIKSKLEKASTANTSLKKELDDTKKKLKQTNSLLDEQIDDSQKMWDEFDALEQYTRKNSLEIHGIPENLYTDPESVVLKVASAINVAIKPEEIEISHKLQRAKKGCRPIIAKFRSHKTKAKLYKERTKLRNVKVSDIFESYASAIEAREGIFINENLTSYRRHIVDKASQMKKAKILTSVWTLDGKIFVKCSPDDRPIRILSEEDLEDFR